MSEPSKGAEDFASKLFEIQSLGQKCSRYDFTVMAQLSIDSALAEKDKEIAELRYKIGTDFMAGVVIEKDERIAELRAELKRVYETTSADTRLFDAQMRIAEARKLIEKLGTVAHDSMDVLTTAEKWLEGKP